MSAPRSGPEARSHSMRGAGVQERPSLQAERLGGGTDVDQSAPCAPASARTPPRWRRPRRGSARTRARSRSVPGSGGCHVRLGDRHRLVAQRVGEQRDAGGGDRPASSVRGARARRPPLDRGCRIAVALAGAESWPSEETACLAAGVGEEDRRRRRRRARAAHRERPCGSPSVPLSETTTGERPARPSAVRRARAARIAGELGRRVGVGAVAEHEVEEQHAARRVGGLGGDPLHPQRGSIIGCARPWVSASSPKSMTTCPSSRRSGPRPRSGRSGMLDRMSPSSASATSIASSASVPPQKRPRSDAARGRRGVLARAAACGQLRHGDALGRRGTPRRGGEVWPPGPERRPVDRQAEPGGIRLDVGEHRSVRRLGDEDERSVAGSCGERGERLPGGAAGDRGRKVAAADAEAVADAHPGGVEQAHRPAGRRCRRPRRCRPDPGRTTLAKPRPTPPTTRGAAVGPHDEHARGGGGVLEAHLVLDGHVVGEEHDRQAGVDRVERLGRSRAGPGTETRARSAPRPADGAAERARRGRVAAAARRPRPPRSPASALDRGERGLAERRRRTRSADGDDEVVGARASGRSKPMPRRTSRLSSVAIATWAAVDAVGRRRRSATPA